MQTILGIFEFITDLGVAAMMPIIITILGLIFRQKFSKALKAGLTVGIGFVGLGAVTDVMLRAIQPVIDNLVEIYDFNLTVIDAGWAIGASMAWGTPVVPVVFLVILAVNTLMIFFKWTKTLNIDIWNYWHAMLPAGIIYLQTRNMIFPIVIAIIVTVIQLLIADWTQKDVEEVLGLEGLSMPHTQANGWAIVGYPVNWLIDRIPGIRKINWSPETIQNRLGFISEPMFLGLIIGFFLSALARMDLSSILQTAISVSASLVLIPRMVSLLMDGLSVITEGAQSFMQDRFSDRELYIGVDAALGIGHPYVIAIGLLMIPMALLLAFILPGNTVMPLADLAVIVYFVIFSIVPSKGNLFRGFITATIIMICTIYLSGAIAPMYTQMAQQIGIDVGSGLITSMNVATGWYNWIVYWIVLFFAT